MAGHEQARFPEPIPGPLRRCKICQQPIEHLHAYRTCCEHPRCKRANRAGSTAEARERARERRADKRAVTPPVVHDEDETMRRYLVRLHAAGATDTQAIAWVVNKTGKRPIEVVALQSEMKRSKLLP